MSRQVRWKVSGKRAELSQATEFTALQWEERPGGVWCAERVGADGTIERVRAVVCARGKRLSAWVGGQLLHGEIEPVVRTSAGGGVSAATIAADLSAQFPGKIRKLWVEPGAVVEEGTPLLSMEAMKMEFQIKAPCAGTVRAFRVTEGQQVSPGELLVDFKTG